MAAIITENHIAMTTQRKRRMCRRKAISQQKNKNKNG
jgi:hypothetical protein